MRVRAWLGWTGALVAVIVAALLLIAHTPPATNRVRAWLTSVVADAWRLDLESSALSYNLLTRRVSIDDVRLSAPGHRDTPIFTARRVTASLPWAVFRGVARVSSIVVEGGRVQLVREEGVLVNLPPPSGDPPPAEARRFDLRGLDLRGLQVDYVDRTGDIDVSVRDLRATLAGRGLRDVMGAGGTIGAASVYARVAEHSTTSGALTGHLTFDGSNVLLDAVTVPFREGTVVAGGRINRVLDETSLDLTLAGTIDLAVLADWTPPPVPVSGTGTFEGTLDGPLGSYLLRAAFGAPAARVGRVTGLPLEGELVLTSARAVVERFRLVMPDPARVSGRPGTVEGRFTYEFGPRGATELTAEFRAVDLDTALAAYDRDPLPLAAWQDGALTLTRALPQAPLRLRANGRSSALQRRDRVAIAGTWDAQLENDRWVVRHDHRLLDAARASGDLRWPAVDDPRRATLSGVLAVQIDNLGQTVGAARRSGIAISESLAGVSGPARGSFDVRGSIDHPLLEGRVESDVLVLPTGAPARASADLAIDVDTLLASRFDVAAQGTRMRGDAQMDWTSGRLSGAVTADVDSVPALVEPWITGAEEVTGTARMSATLGGTTDVPDVAWQLTSTPLSRPAQPIGTLTAEGRLLGTTIHVARWLVDQGPGQLGGSGRFDYESGAYEGTVNGTGLRVVRPVPDVEVDAVAVDLEFSGSGTLEAPGGGGLLRLTPEGGSIAELVGPGEVRWTFTGGQLQGRAFVPRLRTLVDVFVEPRAPYVYSGTAVVSDLDVRPFALYAGAVPEGITGNVGMSATFRGEGTNLAAASAFVNLQEMALVVGGVPVQIERPARLTVSTDDFSVDDLAVRVGGGTLTAQGRFRDPAAEPLRATFSGPLADVVALGRAFGVGRGVSAAGDLVASWESRGGLDRAASTATLRDASVTFEGLPPIEALHADASFDGVSIAVENLRATWQGGGIEGRARVPRALLESGASSAQVPPGRVDLTVRGLTQEALAPWLPAESRAGLDARVSATLALDLTTADLDGVRGTLVLDEASVTAGGVPISQVRPGRLSIANRVLQIDDLAFGTGEPVVIGGSVTFGDTTDLDVTIAGSPGLRPLSALSPAASVDGSASLDVRITGTAQAPRFDGRIDLTAVEFVMRTPRVIASDISGPILLRGDRVELPGLSGFLNGGALDASGGFTVTSLAEMSGAVTFQARGVAVEYPRNVDSEIDALLVFTLGPGTPALRGDVRVLRGAYRATISLPALVALNTQPVPPPGTATFADRVRLDISVSTGDDLVVDNNYGRFEAGADLRLQGTVGRPGLTGRADLRDGGEIFILGGRYQLNASSISFTNPSAIEPDLNVSMLTQSNGAEVTLTLSGTLDRLQTSVVSTDPAVTDQDLVSVLLGGNSLGRDDALALLSGELLGVTGRAIGLDSLRVERGFNADTVRQDPGLIAEDVDPSTRLTLSKRLRADVEVILSQDLRQSGGLSAVVSYKPFLGVELRATSRDNTDRAYTIRHELTFGGGARVSANRRSFPAVATVEFEGAAPGDEPALRDQLRLSPGKRFDFVRWRDDVERLHEWYRSRGFLEARVRASRSDAPDGRAALTYRVQQGPRTELRVVGMDPSSGLRRRLEETWSGSVFDRFLLEELQREVALDLVSRNVVGAAVEAVVAESSEQRKVVQVRVSGGQQAARKEMRFHGTEALSSGALHDALSARGLEAYAWVDPLAIAEPLRAQYASAGYRGARIAPELPRFEGDLAVLSVSVTEGPITRLTGVTFSGVDDELRQAVEAAGSLNEGEAYKEAALDEARRRIESVYRQRGYNDVVVAPRVALDGAEHAATVEFGVTPGPQQRLSEVVVSGTGRTKPSTVVNALRLQPGTPVDFGQWARARKRVFDTNVFRQVEVRPETVPGSATDGVEEVRARVTVTEWPAWRLRYGLQLNDRGLVEATGDPSGSRQRTLGVVGDVQNRNVLGRAFTFGLYGRAERALLSSSTYLTFPTMFGRAVQTNVFGSATRQDLSFDASSAAELRRTRESLSIEQRIRRGRSLEIAYGYRVTHELLRPFDPEDLFLQETVVGRFSGTTFVDRRDDPFDAARGWFASVGIERVSEFESHDDSIKLLGIFYRYQALGRVTLASAVRLGGSLLEVLSFSERFYVGGADTVRGFAENAAGPKDLRGFARGGNALLVLNQELRAPIYGWLKGVVFVDAGNVFLSNRDISVSGLEVGYGAGLRLSTPFSLLRVDLGIPAKGGTRRWYFGIGQVF